MLPMTEIWQIAALFCVTPKYLTKLRGALSRSVVNVCVVSLLIANYPCIIGFHGNNLNAAVPRPFLFPVNSLVLRLFVKQCQVVREEVVGITPSS